MLVVMSLAIRANLVLILVDGVGAVSEMLTVMTRPVVKFGRTLQSLKTFLDVPCYKNMAMVLMSTLVRVFGVASCC